MTTNDEELIAKAMYEAPGPDETESSTPWPPNRPDDRAWWTSRAKAALEALSAAGRLAPDEWEWGVRHIDVDGWVSTVAYGSRSEAEQDYATCGMNCAIVRRLPDCPAGPWVPAEGEPNTNDTNHRSRPQ